jgi:hypothetical protein
MTQTLSPYFASTSLTFRAMAFPKMFIVSKKTNYYVIRLPFVVQKMHDHHKGIHSSSQHPYIKQYNARMA